LIFLFISRHSLTQYTPPKTDVDLLLTIQEVMKSLEDPIEPDQNSSSIFSTTGYSTLQFTDDIVSSKSGSVSDFGKLSFSSFLFEFFLKPFFFFLKMETVTQTLLIILLSFIFLGHLKVRDHPLF